MVFCKLDGFFLFLGQLKFRNAVFDGLGIDPVAVAGKQAGDDRAAVVAVQQGQ